MGRKRPDLVKTFEKNLAALVRDLNALDENIQAIVSKAPAKPLVASHPVYQYFTRRYDLNLKPVLWEPEEIPNHKQLLALQNLLKDHPAKWMIWEGQPIKESVEKLEIMGLHSLAFDPCGNTPDQGDFMSIMWRNVENLKTAFQ